MVKKAAFLDRDGVINEDVVHLNSVASLRILPGVPEAIKRLNEAGYAVVVVTNQGGIAKGIVDRATVEEIHGEIEVRLAKAGAYVDKIYYCPHHPDGIIAEYAIICDCRKPATGMIKTAMNELGIVSDGSFLVGDKASDILAGKAAGLKTVLIAMGAGEGEGQIADFVAEGLPQAIAYFL